MNMKNKMALLVAGFIMAATSLSAQSLADGIKNIYYEKYNTAKDVLQQVYNANPKDPAAIYWLGQAHLQLDDVAGAKALYQKALNEGVNDAWLWIGMGHVEMLEKGDINAAKQKFEQAITATKGKKAENPDILNAIGRANADGGSAVGDPVYGVEKLKRAAEIDKKNPEIYINMGICYLKMGAERGGDAVSAFTEALNRDPKNAKAKFRIAKVYISQENEPIYLPALEETVGMDAAYAPAYLALYEHYAKKNFDKAKENIELFLVHSEKNPKNDLYYADYLFQAGKYQESIDKTKSIESTTSGEKLPGIYLLYAYNYDRLKDSIQSKAFMEKFLITEKPEKVSPVVYDFAAQVLTKFPGNELKAADYYQKAMDADTTIAGKSNYINKIISMMQKAKMYPEQLKWMYKLASTKPELGKVDLNNFANTAFSNSRADIADSLANVIMAKYPNDEFGYFIKVRASKLLDTDSTKGLAFTPIEQYVTFLQKDVTKNASRIKTQYYYMASVYADKLKDYAKAIEVLDKILVVDPADQFANQAKPVLQKALDKIQKQPATAQPKPTGKG